MAAKRQGSSVSPPPPVKRKIESTVTGKAVSSFFKPASQKEPGQPTWRVVNKTLIVGRYVVKVLDEPQQEPGNPRQRKIAAFDLDDTLIAPRIGNKWGRSASGWRWWDDSIPTKLREIHAQGFHIVILSNQSTISLKDNPKLLQKDSVSLVNFKSQLAAVLRQLDLPISVYAATGQDEYRKPRMGMWKEMLRDHDLDGSCEADLEASFYVGDAAGRARTSTRAKDHACSDRDLAANIGIPFYTPNEYFLGAEPEPFSREFEPAKSAKPPSSETGVTRTDIGIQKVNKQDIVLHCGSPGAGKSTFFWKTLEALGYARVNQDILKTRERCLKVAREHLATGRSVAVDNTNATPEVRAAWIELAQSFKIPIRCIHFTASTRLCEHNDTVRAFNSALMNPEKRSILPPVAFRSFASRYVRPDLSEGFQDLTNVDFMFDGTTEQWRVWNQYWVSKFST